MRTPGAYFIRTGIFFILGGSVSSIGGGIGVYRFLRRNPAVEEFTVRELARGLIVPHIFMLLGTGIVIYGAILIVKGIMFNVRMRREMGAGEP